MGAVNKEKMGKIRPIQAELFHSCLFQQSTPVQGRIDNGNG